MDLDSYLQKIKDEQENRFHVNLLKTTLDENKSTISDLMRENRFMQNQLEIQAKHFRETVECQSDEIAQLKQMELLLHKSSLSNNVRYRDHCHCTQRELKLMRQDYNQMKVAINELSEQLIIWREDNAYLKCKVDDLQADHGKAIDLYRKQIEIEIGKKAIEFVQQMSTCSNPIAQNRQIEERNEPQNKRRHPGNQTVDRTQEPKRTRYRNEGLSVSAGDEGMTGPSPSVYNLVNYSRRCHRATGSTDSGYRTPDSIEQQPSDLASTSENPNLSTEECDNNPTMDDDNDEKQTSTEMLDDTEVFIKKRKGERTIIADRLKGLSESAETTEDENEPKTQSVDQPLTEKDAQPVDEATEHISKEIDVPRCSTPASDKIDTSEPITIDSSDSSESDTMNDDSPDSRKWTFLKPIDQYLAVKQPLTICENAIPKQVETVENNRPINHHRRGRTTHLVGNLPFRKRPRFHNQEERSDISSAFSRYASCSKKSAGDEEMNRPSPSQVNDFRRRGRVTNSGFLTPDSRGKFPSRTIITVAQIHPEPMHHPSNSSTYDEQHTATERRDGSPISPRSQNK